MLFAKDLVPAHPPPQNKPPQRLGTYAAADAASDRNADAIITLCAFLEKCGCFL